VNAFLAKGAKTFKGRITGRDGVTRIISYGTRDAGDAREIGRTLKWLREKRHWDVLDLILAKAITPPDAHDAHVGGYLERLVKEKAAQAQAALVKAADPDLDGLVDEWAETAKAKYVTQVRTFTEWLDVGSRRLSSVRRRDISRFLASLKTSGSTKRRYRTALSQFCRHLVERELIDANPVRDVRGASENKPRTVFHVRDDAKALVAILEPRQAALEALMAGTGMEWGAAAKVRRKDIDPKAKSVWAEGGKTQWRARRVFFTEEWAWEYFWTYAKDFTPNGLLFAFDNRRALERHVAGCKAAKVKVTTLHDWRHTYAIYSLGDGMAPQAVKRQLGHSPHSTMLERVYAAWIPTGAPDYAKKTAPAVTEDSATELATSRGSKTTRLRRAARRAASA
jgi:integrase